MINVTKTYLPPLEDYIKYLEKIWASGWITNNGTLVTNLEKELSRFLHVPYVQFVSNGTIAIQIALRALEIKGDVITTPYSYVATTNSILWEGCRPVFVDIDPRTLCIDPSRIEAAITETTTAILAVHVYGYPCDVHQIERIAKSRGLRVVYDAAHAFGCRLHGVSLLEYGDLSTLSFHATKLFHTAEGGAIVAPTPELAEKIFQLKSFGHINDEYFLSGINGKASELHAAMGLCVLPQVPSIIERRREICEAYDAELEGTGIAFSNVPNGFEYNYAYYPTLLKDEAQVLAAKQLLNENGINPRRYFYPSLNQLPFLLGRTSCPISEAVSSRALCLPLYESLEIAEARKIARLVRSVL